MGMLALLVPPPKVHLVRHRGVFASSIWWRKYVVALPAKSPWHLRQPRLVEARGFTRDRVVAGPLEGRVRCVHRELVNGELRPMCAMTPTAGFSRVKMSPDEGTTSQSVLSKEADRAA